MFWSKYRKNSYTPAYPSFAKYIKVGFRGVYITRTCFRDDYTAKRLHVTVIRRGGLIFKSNQRFAGSIPGWYTPVMLVTKVHPQKNRRWDVPF